MHCSMNYYAISARAYTKYIILNLAIQSAIFRDKIDEIFTKTSYNSFILQDFRGLEWGFCKPILPSFCYRIYSAVHNFGPHIWPYCMFVFKTSCLFLFIVLYNKVSLEWIFFLPWTPRFFFVFFFPFLKNYFVQGTFILDTLATTGSIKHTPSQKIK